MLVLGWRVYKLRVYLCGILPYVLRWLVMLLLMCLVFSCSTPNCQGYLVILCPVDLGIVLILKLVVFYKIEGTL